MNKNATEDANLVTRMVILHKEPVAFDDMLGEVPCKPFVKKLGERAEDRRDYARLDVGPNARLGLYAQLR